MEEVNRQVGPLKTTVDRLADTVGDVGGQITRLFNSNGGPPGYLQTARAEDKQTFSEVFAALGHIRPLQDFVTVYNAQEAQRAKDQAERDAQIKASVEKANTKTATRQNWFLVVVGILTLLVGWLTYRDAHRPTTGLASPPAVVRSVYAPFFS